MTSFRLIDDKGIGYYVNLKGCDVVEGCAAGVNAIVTVLLQQGHVKKAREVIEQLEGMFDQGDLAEITLEDAAETLEEVTGGEWRAGYSHGSYFVVAHDDWWKEQDRRGETK